MTEPRPLQGESGAHGARVAIVAARFNDFIVASLLKGATAAWAARGGRPETLAVVRVPGAFELPLAAKKLGASGRYDALVALGCVIRGDTPHFEFVAGECARGGEPDLRVWTERNDAPLSVRAQPHRHEVKQNAEWKSSFPGT